MGKKLTWSQHFVNQYYFVRDEISAEFELGIGNDDALLQCIIPRLSGLALYAVRPRDYPHSLVYFEGQFFYPNGIFLANNLSG